MKMTLHIDEKLLTRVKQAYGLATKTDTVCFALNELDRRAKLRTFAERGLGLLPGDFVAAIDPASYETPALQVADTPGSYANYASGRAITVSAW
jgi:hypothetical protein